MSPITVARPNLNIPAEGVTLGFVPNLVGSEMSCWYSTTFSMSTSRIAGGSACPTARLQYTATNRAVIANVSPCRITGFSFLSRGANRPYRSHSKYQLHLQPHAADAAVCKITIQKAGRQTRWRTWGADHALFRNLSELRMVQGIESLPAKLH